MPDKKEDPVLDENKWTILTDKYGALFYKISHQISGDTMYGFEDTLQDYYFVSIDAIKGFERLLKSGTIQGMEHCTDWDFFKYVDSRPFDKYYKTCLWHYKAKTGQGIVARRDINRALSFSDYPQGVYKANFLTEVYKGGYDPDFNNKGWIEPIYEADYDSSIYLSELKAKFNGSKAEIIDAIVSNPDVLMNTGRLNVDYLAEILSLKPHQVRKELKTLGDLFIGN